MKHQSLHTRREFLRKGFALAAVGFTVPSFITRTVFALDARAAVTGPARTDNRTLVIVQLGGGNDGLNTVIPFVQDEYYRKRPNLGIAKGEILRLNDQVGLHPGLKNFKALYDEGRLAVIQGVGYPNPNRSHFRSMEIWQTAADSDRFEKYGWVGRYFDNQCPGCADNPNVGVAIGGQVPESFRSKTPMGIALTDPDSFQWNPSPTGVVPSKSEMQLYQQLNRAPTMAGMAPSAGGNLDFLSRTAMNAQVSSDKIREVARKYHPTIEYPNNYLANSLKLVAQMIAGGLGTKVFYVSQSGYDTHANQRGDHQRLLTEFADSMLAFQRDIQKQGNADRVAVMCFSEFGRRVQENASGGTDHGCAAPMFVFGAKIKGGVHGAHPSLTELDHGDLKFHTDFRSVYATLLENWLGAKSVPVLGRAFPKLAFV
jgi:uncharacterized protein (DUF1501 family)